jgi:hypothetical protein
LTIRELIEEQRRRMRSPNPAERLAAALLIPRALAKLLRELRDFDLGELLDDEVCSRLSILAPELTICMEAADRLRRPTLSQENESRRPPDEACRILRQG